jgi:hypothetical protein
LVVVGTAVVEANVIVGVALVVGASVDVGFAAR